jgi:hypothetical protein
MSEITSQNKLSFTVEAKTIAAMPHPLRDYTGCYLPPIRVRIYPS